MLFGHLFGNVLQMFRISELNIGERSWITVYSSFMEIEKNQQRNRLGSSERWGEGQKNIGRGDSFFKT